MENTVYDSSKQLLIDQYNNKQASIMTSLQASSMENTFDNLSIKDTYDDFSKAKAEYLFLIFCKRYNDSLYGVAPARRCYDPLPLQPAA